MIEDCKMIWSYYSTCHGKGEWDGVGVVMKRLLWTKQLVNSYRRLQNEEDYVLFLDATMARQVPTCSSGMRSSFLPSQSLFMATAL